MATYNTHRITKKSEVDRFSSASYLYQMSGNTDNFNTNILDHTGFSTESRVTHLQPYNEFDGAIRFNKLKDSLGTELVIGGSRDSSSTVYVDVITYNGVSFHMNMPEVVKLAYPLDKVKLYETNSTTLIEPKPKPTGYTTPTFKYDFIYPNTFTAIDELSPAGISIPSVKSSTKRNDIGKGWFVFYVITMKGSSLDVKLQCSENYPYSSGNEAFHVLGRLVPMFADPTKTTKIETISLKYTTDPTDITAENTKSHDFEYWKWVQYSKGPININKTVSSFVGAGNKYKEGTTDKYKVDIVGGVLEGRTGTTSSYYIPDSTSKGDYSDTEAYIYFLDLSPDPVKGYVSSPSRFDSEFKSVKEMDIIVKNSTTPTDINDVYASASIISDNLSKNKYSNKDPRLYEGVIDIPATSTYTFGIPSQNIIVIGTFAHGLWAQLYKTDSIPIQNYNIAMPVQFFNFQGTVKPSTTVTGDVDLSISAGTVYLYGISIPIPAFSQTSVSKDFHAYVKVLYPTTVGAGGSATIEIGIPPASDNVSMNIDLGYIFENKLKGSLDWYQANFGDIFIGI